MGFIRPWKLTAFLRSSHKRTDTHYNLLKLPRKISRLLQDEDACQGVFVPGPRVQPPSLRKSTRMKNTKTQLIPQGPKTWIMALLNPKPQTLSQLGNILHSYGYLNPIRNKNVYFQSYPMNQQTLNRQPPALSPKSRKEGLSRILVAVLASKKAALGIAFRPSFSILRHQIYIISETDQVLFHDSILYFLISYRIILSFTIAMNVQAKLAAQDRRKPSFTIGSVEQDFGIQALLPSKRSVNYSM